MTSSIVAEKPCDATYYLEIQLHVKSCQNIVQFSHCTLSFTLPIKHTPQAFKVTKCTVQGASK